jgi:hypothetical protein
VNKDPSRLRRTEIGWSRQDNIGMDTNLNGISFFSVGDPRRPAQRALC